VAACRSQRFIASDFNAVASAAGTAGAMLAGSLMLLGLFHGASTYGWRGIVFFIVVCLGVSNAFENLSILTGFPFGWYHYGDKMGPRLFLVPLLIGPPYFGVGYLSWTLARAILGDANGRLAAAGLRNANRRSLHHGVLGSHHRPEDVDDHE